MLPWAPPAVAYATVGCVTCCVLEPSLTRLALHRRLGTNYLELVWDAFYRVKQRRSLTSSLARPPFPHISLSPTPFPPPCRQRLLAAFGDFFESLLPRDGAKVMCVKFICSLTGTLLPGPTSRAGRTGGGGSSSSHTTVGDDPDAAREVCRWLQSLPELLCRWEGELPESSAEALGALLGVAKHAPSLPPPAGTSRGDGAAKGKTAASAAAAVVAVSGGTNGAWATASSELVRSISPALLGEFFSGRGFLALPPSAQLDAVSLLFHLPAVPACVVSALAAACSEPEALRVDVRSFVFEVSAICVVSYSDLAMKIGIPFRYR